MLFKITVPMLFSLGISVILIAFIVWQEALKNAREYVKPLIIGMITNFILLQFLFCPFSMMQRITLCSVTSVLALATYSDLKEQEVYRAIWIIPAMLSIPTIPQKAILDLFIFICLQFLVFVRFYGKADAFAFCICAGTLTIVNGDLFVFLLMMLIALTLLVIINFFKDNVTKKLNLKQPKPFIPYIFVSWLIILIIMTRRQL